jgi:subtilisin-like proprotein convertase family protein
LSSFNGLSADGTWTLFLADMSASEESTLVSWGLQITAVPEPVTVTLAIFAATAGATQLVLWLVRRRHRRRVWQCS